MITKRVTIVLVLMALAVGWRLGSAYESYNLSMPQMLSGNTGTGGLLHDPEKTVNLDILWTTWRLMQQSYINPSDLNTQKMVYGAAAGLVEAVGDPYSVFMDPDQNHQFQDTLGGTLEGIGAELILRDGLPVVVSPIKGSPAEKAGIMPEDVIIEVNGVSTNDRTLTDVIKDIRGQRGTHVKIAVARDGQRLDFDLVREKIDLPSVQSEIKVTGSGSVGVITINQFGERTTDEVEKAMSSFTGKQLKGLIIDVRYNGGGYLDRAVELASMYMKEGKVVSVAKRVGEPEVHYVLGSPIDTKTPMVVLQNQGSASASEILAGALHDNHRAVLIGVKSFGKGTIQEIFPIAGGASLRVTVAKWLTPNGTDIGHQGIEPDYKVELTEEDAKAKVDTQMNAALEYLLDGDLPAQTGGSSSATSK